MKKKAAVFLLLLLLLIAKTSEADLPVLDAVNAALNELRNSLMQSQFAQDIAIAIERLDQLKATYLELLRFHSGLDDFLEVFAGDPLKDVFSGTRGALRDAFIDFGWITPEIESLNQANGPADIRASLERLTGKIPQSDLRPYIPFEESQVVSGFDLAQEIRNAGQATRDAASSISDQAKQASPKGAARLQTEALSQMMVLSQQNQEAMAKLLELEATQVEQVSREEKRIEWERQKYTEDAKQYLESVLQNQSGGGIF